MTTTKTATLRRVLNDADPTKIADALRLLRFGNRQVNIMVVAASLTAAASFDVTTAAFLAKCTVTGITLDTGENLSAIMNLHTLRVTASGTAASVGTYIVSDASGTPTLPTGGASAGVGIATISADGKTLTFPNTVTAFTFSYQSRSATVDPDTYVFAPST